MPAPSQPTVVKITHLRDCLGIAYQQVVRTDEPIVIQRYGKTDVVMVAKWEYDFFKQLEAGIKAGCCPVGRERGEACPCSLSG